MHNLKLRTIYIITQNVLAPKKLIHSRNSKNTTPNLQGLEILEAIVFFISNTEAIGLESTE